MSLDTSGDDRAGLGVACGFCHRDLSAGSADVGGVRYCHDGGWEDFDMMLVQEATCYELANLALASSAPDALLTDFYERWLLL